MAQFDPGDNAASIASMTDRYARSGSARPLPPFIFSRERGLCRRRGKRLPRRRAGRGLAGPRSMAAAFYARPATGRALSWAAMTASWFRSMPKARSRCWPPTPSGAGSTTSRCIPTARSPGRPARPPLSARQERGKILRTRPRPSAGLPSRQRGCALRSRTTNGVSLWFPNMAAKPEIMEWAGSHLAVTFSPDNKFLVTAMHEPALHGWRPR